MDRNFKTAIEKWRKAYGPFEKELEQLYRSLVEAFQGMPGAINGSKGGTQEPPGMQQVCDFLAENNQDMDSCVRWHLLRLAINNARSGSTTETSNVHLQLAKKIMSLDSKGENLFFYSPRGKNITSLCEGGKRPERANQQPADRMSRALPYQKAANASAHFGAGSAAKEKPLFLKALCEGHPFMGELLAELMDRKSSQREDIASLARRKAKDSHRDLAGAHKTAPRAFRQVLCKVPGFLKPEDTELLNRVIDDPLPSLASVILASEKHAALLTSHERIVQAIEKWMETSRRSVRPAGHPSNGHDDDDDDDDDDDNDGDGGNDDDGDDENDPLANPQKRGKKSKTDQRRDLVRTALTHAPETVLQSPKVLSVLMQYGLLEDSNIIDAYSKHFSPPDSSQAPTASGFASFLDKVPGILHTAVFFQQKPLVEALLRCAPLLAVTRGFVQSTTVDGGTIPKKEEKNEKNEKKEGNPSTETAAAAVNGVNGVNGVKGVNGVNGANGVNGTSGTSGTNDASSVAPSDQEAVSGCYPLWFNKAVREKAFREKDDAKWKHIRSALIYCTMKHAENMQTLLSILRESEEPEHEINFDMSRLLIEGTSVADFVKSMPRHGRSHSLIRYEETIRYAEFPELDLNTRPQTPAAPNQQRSYLTSTHTEVIDMLDWLSEHGVRRIITLRVPDRMADPHDELEIAEVVKRFRVEELDWRILDLSLTIFEPHGGPNDVPLVCCAKKDTTCLTRLHLYTGGRRSAIDHWFSAEGLKSMKLESVRIVVVKFWTTQTESPRLQDIIHCLSPRLAQFVRHYRSQVREHYNSKPNSFQPTKVAIIDNGILSMEPPSNAHRVAERTYTDATPDVHSSNSSERHLHSEDFFTADSLWSRVCEGKSFVEEPDRLSPWYLASNPHGTQMANLICAIDPLCQIFVAKIADSHYGYSASRAAAAVCWAIKNKVDIISMSFTTSENDKQFNAAVKEAMSLGILVVCSHHDEGARISKDVYPASLGSAVDSTMLRMASCNMYGKLLHDWDDSTVDEASKKINQFDFCINSQDIAVGAIPFLAASTEYVSGSSVATAIAAGLCSLLIACLRFLGSVPEDSAKLPEGRKSAIKKAKEALQTNSRPTYAAINTYLASMAPSTTNPRFISLDRFARLDELRDVSKPSLQDALFTLGARFLNPKQ